MPFPFTKKLTNPLFLLKAAIFTRAVVALARIFENTPFRNTSPDYTQEQKSVSLAERMLIEVVGTVGYTTAIYTGTDVAANWLEKGLKAPNIVAGKGLTEAQAKKINVLINDLYPQKAGKIYRNVFDGSQKKLLDGLKTILGSEDITHHPHWQNSLEPLQKFVMKTNVRSALAMGVGVLAGAVIGGNIIQYVNDRIFSPFAKTMVGKLYAKKRQQSALPGPTSLQSPLPSPPISSPYPNPMAQNLSQNPSGVFPASYPSYPNTGFNGYGRVSPW